MSTFWTVARRPKWIGVLLLALGVAAAFAALGQWQLERSFTGGEPEFDTEVAVPLTEIAQPQQPVMAEAYRLVDTEVQFVAEDYLAVGGRVDAAGTGYWVVGHGVTPDGASLAVALGWTATEGEATSAIQRLRTDAPTDISGRYLPSEQPSESDFQKGIRTSVSVADLINVWSQPPAGVYGGILIAADAPAGMTAIDAPPPDTSVQVNLLNLFYAVEWVIFGGFAVFLWYRVVKDEVEKENEGVDA